MLSALSRLLFRRAIINYRFKSKCAAYNSINRLFAWSILGKTGQARSKSDSCLPTSDTSTRLMTRDYKMASLENLNFDNLVLRSLPIDPIKDNYVRVVNGACFSLVQPTPVENPEIVAVSLPALKLLDLDVSQVERPEFVQYFSGNKLLPGSETAAHCYCGHQFGFFAGQLGDGAAM